MPILGQSALSTGGGVITPSGTTALEIVSPPRATDFAVDKFGSVLIVSDIATQHTLGINANTRPDTDHRILQITSGVAFTEEGGFDRDGYFYTLRHSAPADADIGAGQLLLWFDQTNGAAKLMVRAKTANGTAVTGSLALA